MSKKKNDRFNAFIKDAVKNTEALNNPAQASHTPGPWAYTLEESEPFITAMQGNTNIAMLFDVTGNEHLANARLIARAPDMLNALHLAHRELKEFYARTTDSEALRVVDDLLKQLSA